MDCEVIVVGAGIGGLTTAALLSARGVDVRVFERHSYAGGCVANFEHLGFNFEPTFGLYSGWEAGGTWDRVFAELPVQSPMVTRLLTNFVVRLPAGRDVPVSPHRKALEDEIAVAFADCADPAIRFLRRLTGDTIASVSAAEVLGGTSREFRWFIDAQLQMFAQCTGEQCSVRRAAAALRVATGQHWSIGGGAQALVDRLVESLKTSGGSLRLNSPVLRLAYGTDGRPIGVDLLNGERVFAQRAIVSNLTVWDTYGKLIGLGRNPRHVASELKNRSAWGAYHMFVAIDEVAVERLPHARTLLVYETEDQQYQPDRQQLMLNLTRGAGAPTGKLPLTTVAFTKPDEWFAFHQNQTWHEEKDQATLQAWWTRLHDALPNLADSVEVIETSTPQTVYDMTRRRLGMIGVPSGDSDLTHLAAPFENVFLVGDTASTGFGLEGIAKSAFAVANRLQRARRVNAHLTDIV